MSGIQLISIIAPGVIGLWGLIHPASFIRVFRGPAGWRHPMPVSPSEMRTVRLLGALILLVTLFWYGYLTVMRPGA